MLVAAMVPDTEAAGLESEFPERAFSRRGKRSKEVTTAMMVSERRSTFGINCVRCDNELIAPERSEYRHDSYIRHLWHCSKCDFYFATVVETASNVMTRDDIFPSLSVGEQHFPRSQ